MMYSSKKTCSSAVSLNSWSAFGTRRPFDHIGYGRDLGAAVSRRGYLPLTHPGDPGRRQSRRLYPFERPCRKRVPSLPSAPADSCKSVPEDGREFECLDFAAPPDNVPFGLPSSAKRSESTPAQDRAA